MARVNSWAATAALMVLAGSAQASAVFQGRLADGTPSSTCTSFGATKCTSYYDPTLNITILNNWGIGTGIWDTSVSASAQGMAFLAGFSATGLGGWRLPTGDFSQPAGALNQYLSIWNDVGHSFIQLSSQFDGVQADDYWSSSTSSFVPGNALYFRGGDGFQQAALKTIPKYVVAVRAGDVADTAPPPPRSVPEPQALALALLALGAAAATRKRTA